MRTSNPALKDAVFTRERAAANEAPMTLQGTTTKSLLLIGLVIFSAAFTWTNVLGGNAGILIPALLVGSLGGLVLAIVTVMSPRVSPYTAPLYAVLKGLALGAISAYYQARFRGLPIQAVALTAMVFLAMMLLYRTGLVRATERFTTGVVAATLGIALVYVLTIGLALFGVGIPYIHDSGMIGIAFSLLVVGVASLNLILDFDLIERGVQARAARYMEWYGAFGLLVTLVWLYLELLRLLSKLQSRR
jgi:uncharacterized YccA/Bax inhibitor family protein